MFSLMKGMFLAVVLGVLSTLSMAATPSEPSKEVLIKFNEKATLDQINSLTKELGLVKFKTFDEIGVQVFRISSDYSVDEVVRLCSNEAFVAYAEPTATVRASFIEPNPEAIPAEPALAAQAQVAAFKPGEVIIKFKSGVGQEVIARIFSSVGISTIRQFNRLGIYQCSIGGSKDVLKAIEECNADSNVEYAEPNYIYKASVTPNDPLFSDLFGMTITDAPQAWDIQTGSKSVIVGVVDTGVDYTHEDLSANMWTNPGESGANASNGVDDDGNGFVDDLRGWDFANNDNDPRDDNDHGSHVSGTIGAVGNNSKGVVGVNWNVSIMPLKFLGANGSGSLDGAIGAILYGVNNGAKILSNSWGGGGRSQALEDAIQFANDNGVLFIAAAGNDSRNNDNFPSYPANYDVPNVISVAATTSRDLIASFSNFGINTVHLAAPGQDILSTTRGNNYLRFSGTSMATPHVSGAAALVWAQYPGLTSAQVKVRILGSVERNNNIEDLAITGGRLNVNNALSTNPIIANTTRLKNTLDETGPYIVEADILDDGSIQNATLTYQVGGQSAVTVNMSPDGTEHYKGEIAGQTLGSNISYFVSASDNDGNETRDRSLSFSIAQPPRDRPGCGCGKPAIDFDIRNEGLKTTANAVANLSFFVLPVIVIGWRQKRKKK
ncbi:MAG: S8 family peptidase [bacterium]